MTFLTAITEVATKAKLATTDATTLLLIKQEINRAVYELTREKRISELLVANLNITLTTIVADLGRAALPADFLVADQFFFRSTVPGASPYIKEWELIDRKNSPVPPAAIYSKPTNYTIVAGSTTVFAVLFDPYAGIVPANDVLTLDYYKTPTALSADADVVPASRWESEIIRRATAQILIRENKLEQAAAIDPATPAQQPPQ